MQHGFKKKLWVALFVCGAGTVGQFLPGGCTDYYAAGALTAIDFCSVFNCEGGTFIDLCGTNPLLADCPEVLQADQTP